MVKIDLKSRAHIWLVKGRITTLARLEYSELDQCFVVQLPMSGIFGDNGDLRLKLTEPLLERVAYLPDGGLELRL